MEDEAAALLDALDADGIPIGDLDPLSQPTQLSNVRLQADRRWLIAAAKRKRMVEVFARDPFNLQAAIDAVGWTRKAYGANRKKDPRFAAEIDALRGGRLGRPKRDHQIAVLKDRLGDAHDKLQAGTTVFPVAGPMPLPADLDDTGEGWTGFTGFRKAFFRMETPWFQQQVIDTLETSQKGSITLILLPPESGKLVSDTTAVATPEGWRKMADLEVGSRVFGRDGKPTTVTAVFKNPSPEMRRVTFTDGSTIDACVDHRWLTRTRKPQHGQSVKTTAEIEATLTTVDGRPNHAIPVCEPLQLPEADLPLDPWLLGYWLGNGTRGIGAMTTHVDDVDWVAERVRDAGYACSTVVDDRPPGRRATVRPLRLAATLRALRVIEHKHVPAAYLFASESQRRALLAGLLDSDGCASGSRGRIEFASSVPELADAVLFLARSIGLKPTMKHRIGKYNGKVCKPSHRVFWTMREQNFTSPRKTAMWQPAPTPQGDRLKWRMIADVQPIPSTPGRCITVDNTDHLWLAGEELLVTSNTSLLEDWINFKLATVPEFRIVYGSERQAHCRKVIKRVKNRMHPDGPAQAYVERFGPFVPQTGDDAHPQAWNQDFFDVWRRVQSDDRDYNMVGLGFGSAVAGTRCDLLVLDDVQSLKSLNLTDKIVDEFRQDWLSRPGSLGKTVILGTRVGEGDFYERIMELDLVDHLVKYPAVDSKGRFLWPERYSERDYNRMRKNVGEAAWARNYQQRPSAASERTFTESDITQAGDTMHRIGTKPGHYPDLHTAIVGHDPGFGTNAFFVAGVTADKFVALDWRTDHGLTSTGQMGQILADLCEHWRGQAVRVAHLVIEDKAFQHGLLQDEAILAVQREFGFSISGHQTSATSKLDDDLGVAAMARSFRVGEIVLPAADDPDTIRARAAFDAELASWRPMKRGVKLRQDLVMGAWFAWMRWRSVRHSGSGDRSNVIRMDSAVRRPTPFKSLTLTGGNR